VPPVLSADGLSGNYAVDQGVFPCDAAFNPAIKFCRTQGLTLLRQKYGVHGSQWTFYGQLVLLLVCFRLANRGFYYVSFHTVLHSTRDWFRSTVSRSPAPVSVAVTGTDYSQLVSVSIVRALC
jgi:hypothetical protein